MASEPVYNSRTYGFSVHAPETLSCPITLALTGAIPASPQRQNRDLLITDGSKTTNAAGGQLVVVSGNGDNAAAVVSSSSAPTRSIAIIGGRSRHVDDDDVDDIVAAWSDPDRDPSDVKNIDLSLNKISSKGFVNLLRAISDRPGQLQDLEVNSNKLTDDALKAIVQYLINNPNVKVERLDLSTNKFTDLGVVAFFQALKARCADAAGHPLALRTLLLRQNDLTNTSLRAICDFLKDAACPLTALHISGNDFTELDGIQWIAEVIATNTSLIDFNVSNCFDYVARWEPIADAITNHSTTLRQFNIAVAGKKPEMLLPCDEVLKKNRIRALSQESEIDRVKKQHKKEIENLNAAHKRREQELENKIFSLMAELEKIRKPTTSAITSGNDAEEL